MGAGETVVSAPIRFGDDFELDLLAYELRRSGQILKVERIPMELLRLLIEHPGHLVSREKIVERIWGKEVFVDTDNSINAAVRKVRQVLDDNPEQPRFVQTVTGKGYKFIAPVETSDILPVPTEADQPEFVADQLELDDLSVARPRFRRSIWHVFLAALILGTVTLLALSAGLYQQWFRRRVASPVPVAGRAMLAVLPFQNLTGDASQEYFSDGLTEEMIAQLGRLDPQRIGVIGRTSVMHYKGSPAALDQIGRELGVQYVLEGSVRRDSGKARISAQLIQVKDQTHLWTEQYDRDLNDLLALQSEVARQISGEIRITLGDGQANPQPFQGTLYPRNYEAYDLYLKGQYFWNKRTVDDFQRAVGYFQQAIAKDPNFARAYAGLADSYALMGEYAAAQPQDFMPKARAAALQALKLDDSLPEAHTALALIVQNYDYDWQTSDKEFRRAIELNPNYATAHHWYAEHLAWLGRFDEALAESEKAKQLDPLSLIIACDNGSILYYSRQYDRAIKQFHAVEELDANFQHTLMIVGPYEEKGMFAEALADLNRKIPSSAEGPWSFAEKAYIYGRTGQFAQARLELAKLEELNRRQSVDPAVFIRPIIGIGDKEQAFMWLERAYLQHANMMTTLKVDPVYDPLRGDPRFQDLLRRVGLTQ